MTTQSVQVKLELGHKANVRKKQTVDGFTHDWVVFVRGPEGCNIQYFVEKVVFHLHDSFPKPKRVVKEPPYQVQESGYAGFNLPIEIYFKNKEEPKKIRFHYDLFLHLDGCPPVNHIRCEKLTFQNPTEEFRRKLLKAGGVSLTPVGVPGPNDHVLFQQPQPATILPPTCATVTTPQTPESRAFADLFGAPLKADTHKKHRSHSSSKEKSSTSSSGKPRTSGSACSTPGSTPGSAGTPTAPSIQISTPKEHKTSSPLPTTTLTLHPTIPSKDKSTAAAKEREREKATREKEKLSAKRSADSSPSPTDVAKKKRKESSSGSKERDKDKEKSKSRSSKDKDKDSKEKGSHKSKRDGEHKSGKHDKLENKSAKLSTSPGISKAIIEPEPPLLHRPQLLLTASKPATVAKNRMRADLPPFEDEVSAGELSDFDPFGDDNDIGNRSPVSSLSPSSVKGSGGVLSTLMAELNDEMVDEDGMLSPLPCTSPTPLFQTAPSLSPVVQAAANDKGSQLNKSDVTKESPASHKSKSKKKEKEKKSKSDKKSKERKENKDRNSKESKENRESKDSGSKDREKDSVSAEAKDTNGNLRDSGRANRMDTVEQVLDANGHNKAPNGEYFAVLLDLQRQLMSMTDRDLLQRVVNVIEETGLYKITDATFDFDLCCLDSNTVHRLQSCLDMA